MTAEFSFFFLHRLQRSLLRARRPCHVVDIWQTHHLWMNCERKSQSKVHTLCSCLFECKNFLKRTNPWFLLTVVFCSVHHEVWSLVTVYWEQRRQFRPFHCISDVHSLKQIYQWVRSASGLLHQSPEESVGSWILNHCFWRFFH